jgi:HNH endonuclease
LTADELRDLLDYDPDTGIFQWKVRASKRVKPGMVAGTVKREGYRTISIKRKHFLAHRLAWFWMTDIWPSEIDHINRTPDDNRWSNLREATRSVNMRNTTVVRKNSSGYRNITRNKNGGYVVRFSQGDWKNSKVVIHQTFRRLEDAIDLANRVNAILTTEKQRA